MIAEGIPSGELWCVGNVCGCEKRSANLIIFKHHHAFGWLYNHPQPV